MREPDDDFRGWVASAVENVQSEDQLDDVLGEIEGKIEASLGDESDPAQTLDAVFEWASVASYPIARFYAPASPWPKNVAGWGKKAVARLRRIAGLLRTALQAAAAALGAASFSIGVSFPWGISIGLSW
jgi:hypothetical protein